MTVSRGGVDVLPLDEALALGEAAWDGLRRDAPITSPFATWAWHRAWAEAAPAEELASSRVLVLRSGAGEVAGVLPLRLARSRFRRVPATVLTWAIGDRGCPDHLDIPALPDADLGAFVPHLDRLPWDVLLLGNVAERSPNTDRLWAACERRGWSVRRTPVWRCPYLELPESWDAYLAGLSPTRRQTIRRKERNLGRQYAVALTDYGRERLNEGWVRLKELHARRWNGAGALGGPYVEGLHRAFTTTLAERGDLWLATLDLDGEPTAAWVGFAAGDTVCFYQGGWDPRWERESVGAVLMGMMIRRAIERGYRIFDFLRGEEPYKLTWTSTVRTCSEVAAMRRDWRGVGLSLLDQLATWRDAIRGHSESSVTSETAG